MKPKKSYTRIRPRMALTLAPETIAILQEIEDSGGTNSLSKAIDLVAFFYKKNQSNFIVELESDMRRRFAKACIKKQKDPQKHLAFMAVRYTTAVEHDANPSVFKKSSKPDEDLGL